jgi:hypothetical protein
MKLTRYRDLVIEQKSQQRDLDPAPADAASPKPTAPEPSICR